MMDGQIIVQGAVGHLVKYSGVFHHKWWVTNTHTCPNCRVPSGYWASREVSLEEAKSLFTGEQ
jgi:hypothetical protein